MADRIKPSDAKALAAVLLDEEQSKNLTVSQVGQMNKQLRTFQNEQSGRIDSFMSQGMDDVQARALLDKENEALESGNAIIGGKLKRFGAPGQGQVFHAAQAINAGAEGVWRAVEGAGDLMNEIGVGLNLNSREDADRYKDTIASMRFERAMADVDTFGRTNPRLLEAVGEVAPWFATAGVGASAGLLRYSLGQAMVGGLANVTHVSDDPLSERRGDFAIGAGLGGAFGGIFGIPGNLKAGSARAINSALNKETAAANVELEQAIQGMLDNGDFGFSLSQVSGNRFLFGLEQRAAGEVQKGRQNENIQALYDHILKRAKDLGDQGKSANEIGITLRDTLTQANKAIHERASETFGRGLDEINDTYGVDIVMSYKGGQEYLAKLDDMLGKLDDPLNPGPGASRSWKAYRTEVDRLVNPARPQQRTVKGPDGKNRIVYDVVNRRTGEVTQLGQTRAQAMERALIMNNDLGGLTAGEIRRVQENLNGFLTRGPIIEAEGETNKHLAKALMGNLFENLEANAKNPEAVEALTGLSDAYKAEMLRVQKMEDLVVARMFGLKQMPPDADAALDTVLQGGESSLIGTRDFLMEWNPELLGELQGTLLRRFLEQAGDAASPQVDVPIALDKFANALSGRGPNGQVIGQSGRGLFTEGMQAELLNTGKALRTIKNLYFTGVAPGGVTVDDMAINIVSRSPEFMSRFLTRALTTGKGMDQVLTDPMTRQALRTIAEDGPTSRTGNAAMLVLANWISVNDEATAQQEGAQQNRNAINRTSNVLQ